MTLDEFTKAVTAIEAARQVDVDRAEALVLELLTKTENDEGTNGTKDPWLHGLALRVAAEVAMDAGRLELALQRVTPLLARTFRFSPNLASRVWLLAAEALARSGRPQEARTCLGN